MAQRNIKKNEKQDRDMEKFLSAVFNGMQGRYTRLKIILAIAQTPMNISQLSKEIGYDYKSVQHNIRILEKNNLIESVGDGYGDQFFVSEFLNVNLPTLLEVIEKVDRKLSAKKVYIS